MKNKKKILNIDNYCYKNYILKHCKSKQATLKNYIEPKILTK